MKRQWLILIGALVVLAAVIAFMTMRNEGPAVTDFASCAAAGNPIMESYPEQCHHNGTTYTNPNQQPVSPPIID